MRSVLTKLSGLALPVLLVCSLGANVQLTRRLKASHTQMAVMDKLLPGEKLPPLEARRSNGDAVTINYAAGEKGTLLYYFDPHCGWCKKNGANFKALNEAIGNQYQVISYTSVVLDLDDYRRTTGHAAEVITDDATDLRRILRVRGTPQTIVIGRDGTVQKIWEGAYTKASAKEIESYFHVQLPGVSN